MSSRRSRSKPSSAHYSALYRFAVTTTMPSTESNTALLQHYLRALTAASQARDMERALAIGDEAVRRGVEHPNLLGLAAQRRMRTGNIEGALSLLERARELSPDNVEILNDLGLCLVRLGRPREAVVVLDEALGFKPGSAQIHFSKALAHEQMSELDTEQRLLERTVELEPGHHRALSLLAMLAAERGDGRSARDYATRALALSPKENPARFGLVSADLMAGEFDSARERLEKLLRDTQLDPDSIALAQTMMGDLLDAQRQYADAFRFYQSSAQTRKSYYARAHPNPNAESFGHQIDRLTAYVQGASEKFPPGPKAVASERVHVFILGFVRSGTTLLGQILSGHPDIEVVHERDCLQDAARDFLVPADGVDRLSSLSDEALNPYRDLYWEKVRSWGCSADRAVFVDKAPLATAQLPLIARLFPAAKILFAIRDPRDVVLSCFRRRFAMTDQKYEMLMLDEIAARYGQIMTFGEISRKAFALDILEARHETLLENPRGEAKRICEHLGIAFHEPMLDFSGRARNVNIDTPNSADLARGLLRERAGHWRHYRNELDSIMPIVAPWCERFGYPGN